TNINLLIRKPLTKWTLKRLQHEYNDYLVEWRIAFSEHGVDSRADGFHLTIAWKRFKTVKVTKDYIFLYIYRQWGETIPIRLFESPVKQEEFIKYLENNIPTVPHSGLFSN